VPTWASTLPLHLHLDASTLHMTVLTLNLNNMSPLNRNNHLKTSQHVHAHHLGQVEERRCLYAVVEVHARQLPRIGHFSQ
jgi:hypothetical protein